MHSMLPAPSIGSRGGASAALSHLSRPSSAEGRQSSAFPLLTAQRLRGQVGVQGQLLASCPCLTVGLEVFNNSQGLRELCEGSLRLVRLVVKT